MAAKLYTLDVCEDVISKYVDNDGFIVELTPGSLGYGLTVCFGDGLKTCVIKEVYINEWQSAHTIRFYNQMPKKYAKMIEELESAA